MKKIVLISAILVAFVGSAFAAHTPNDGNQTGSKTHHQKAKKAKSKHTAKADEKTKEKALAE